MLDNKIETMVQVHLLKILAVVTRKKPKKEVFSVVGSNGKTI